MTFADERARALWAETVLHVWPETYVLALLPREAAGAGAAAVARAHPAFAALVLEREGASLTLPESVWASDPARPRVLAEAGPFRVVTFDLELDLDVCGYLAPAAASLAAAGVPIVPQCGYSRDHLLVPADRIVPARAALERLVAAARSGAGA